MSSCDEILSRLSDVPFLAEAGHADQWPLELGCCVTAFRDAVRIDSWSETWPGDDGSPREMAVTAELWTDAINLALEQFGSVHIPYRAEPYYLDGPIILKTGRRLVVDPNAEIRLKPHTNTCMVRNASMVSGANAPVEQSVDADEDISIQGGIWTTLATMPGEYNGNVRGWADKENSIHGAHGTINLHNVRRVSVRGVTIRQCRPYGIQFGQACEFYVESISFDDTHRDGVHVNGPSSFGIIRDLGGVTGDDMVALNAWDWKNSTVAFGTISNVLVENVRGVVGHRWSEIRMLPGTKTFDDGQKTACDIRDCVFRNISGVHTFKMYDQPNLEVGRDNDFCDPIGNMQGIHLRDIAFEKPTDEASLLIGANAEDITLDGVELGFDPDFAKAADYRLVRVGPMSMTYKHNPDDVSTWVEVFSPDSDCIVKGLKLSNVQSRLEGSTLHPVADPRRLVEVVEMTINEDYPNTTPRGGTGRGRLLD